MNSGGFGKYLRIYIPWTQYAFLIYYCFHARVNLLQGYTYLWDRTSVRDQLIQSPGRRWQPHRGWS